MSTRPRVAFISEHAGPLAALGGEDSGGQNVYVAEVTRNLARLGFDVDIFVRGDGSQPTVVEWSPSVRVIHLQVGPPGFLPKDDLWPLMPAFRDALLAFARSQVRRSTRARRSPYALIHSNFWMSGWVAVELKERLKLPVAHIFHATGVTKRRYQGEADTSPDERIDVEKRIIREVDRILAQCPAEFEELLTEYGADPGKIAITPAGVDLQRFRPMGRLAARAELGLDPDAFTIVYVGRMVRRKGVRNILRALPFLLAAAGSGRAIHLLAVGGESAEPDPAITPEIGALQTLAAELGVTEHVTFTGARPTDELYKYYSAGDVVVTTPWYEPFGLTPLEAMACARPVVGAAVGGIQYTVRDGLTGLLVPPRAPEQLAAALRRFLDEKRLAVTMGMAARARVEKQFSWPRVAERVAAVYRGLMAEQPRPAVRLPHHPSAQPGEAVYGAD